MLKDTRAASDAFVADLVGDQLMGPKLDIVNPILWEFGHLAWFQEHFILGTLDGRDPLRAGVDALYNSMRVAYDDRWDLPLPSLEWTKAYGRDVLAAVLERLTEPLASEADSYFYQLATFHEDMHTEAFSYSRQTLGLPRAAFGSTPETSVAAAGPWPGDAEIPGGTFQLGASRDARFVFDNEKWAHETTVAPFAIARAPVTHSEFATFVEAGGYDDRALWSQAGWAWRQASDARLPAYWEGGPGDWRTRRFDEIMELPRHQPVMHVNWYEASAYCAFAGRRLPSESRQKANECVKAVDMPRPSTAE